MARQAGPLPHRDYRSAAHPTGTRDVRRNSIIILISWAASFEIDKLPSAQLLHCIKTSRLPELICRPVYGELGRYYYKCVIYK